MKPQSKTQHKSDQKKSATPGQGQKSASGTEPTKKKDAKPGKRR